MEKHEPLRRPEVVADGSHCSLAWRVMTIYAVWEEKWPVCMREGSGRATIDCFRTRVVAAAIGKEWEASGV
jgi:hypothetical protein